MINTVPLNIHQAAFLGYTQSYPSVLWSVGYLCEVNVDDCAPTPGSFEPRCLNGGQCADGVGRYTCSCPPGFVGEHCEGDLNECLSTPCHAPGSLDCVQLVNDYQCRCRLGYTGTLPKSSLSCNVVCKTNQQGISVLGFLVIMQNVFSLLINYFLFLRSSLWVRGGPLSVEAVP